MNLCPDDNELAALLSGQLSGEDAENVQRHLDTCAACAELFLAYGDLLAPTDGPPESIGRYEVQEILGQGAMGVVYLALDPALGRQVAIKVLHPDLEDTDARAQQRARLLQEARALASLSHPNIVTVYDVGEHEGQVFLGMEFIEGSTMREWLRDSSPEWGHALDAYLQAGRGLAHAHEAGVVHRDIKPDNLLLEANTHRVLVTDFGLARPAPPSSSASFDLDVAQTATGALLGTPAYMSPEQFEGLDADARSDQYALASCIYEALYGRRPYFAHDMATLSELVRTQPPRDPGPCEIPRAIFTTLARALSAHPRSRFPDMSAMLEALALARRPAPPTRRRALLLAGTLLVTAGLGVLSSTADVEPDPTRPPTTTPTEVVTSQRPPQPTPSAPPPADLDTPPESKEKAASPEPAPVAAPRKARKPKAPAALSPQERNRRFQQGNLKLGRLAHTRQWKECLRLAPKVMALASHDISRTGVENTLYLCEMMGGECEEGSARFERLQKQRGISTPGAIAAQLKMTQDQYCRIDQGDLATQLRRTWNQMSIASSAVAPQRCRKIEAHALHLLEQHEDEIRADKKLRWAYGVTWSHAQRCLDAKASCKERWRRHKRSRYIDLPKTPGPGALGALERSFLSKHHTCAATLYGKRMSWEIAVTLQSTLPQHDKRCVALAKRTLGLAKPITSAKVGEAIEVLRHASKCAAKAGECGLSLGLFERMLSFYDTSGMSDQDVADARRIQRQSTMGSRCPQDKAP